MIKRVRYLFLIFVFMFAPNIVFASGDYNHILNIESLKFNGSKINIEGYSFISNKDNYGIIKNVDENNDGVDDGNLKTFMVAFTGFASSSDEWTEWLADLVRYDNDDKTIYCNSESEYDCYIENATIVDRNFWWARCNEESCADQMSIESGRLNTGFDVTRCDEDSSCIYKNVGFEVNLDLVDVVYGFLGLPLNSTVAVEQINDFNESIGLAIVSVNTTDGTLVAREMSIPYGICKYMGSSGVYSDCVYGEQQEFVSGGYSYRISEPQKQVLLDADGVNVIESDDAFTTFVEKDDYHFFKTNKLGKAGTVYNSLNYLGKSVRTRVVNSGEGVISGSFEDVLYKMAAFVYNGSCSSYPKDADGNYSIDSSSIYCALAQWADAEGNIVDNNNYWAYGNWVRVSGSFRISSFQLKTVSVTCDNLFESGATDGNVNCNLSGSETTKLSQCIQPNESVSTYIYVSPEFEIKDDLEACYGMQNYASNRNENLFYVPLSVNTNVLLNQKGSLTFNKMSNSPVRAGKGFEIVNSSSLYYYSLLEWSYRDWFESDSNGYMPYYTLESAFRNPSDCNTFVSINEIVSNYVGSKFYVLNDDGYIDEDSAMTLEEAVFNAVDRAVQKKYYSEIFENPVVSNSSSYSRVQTNFNSKVGLNTCDSNRRDDVCEKYTIKGGWNLDSSQINTALRYLDSSSLAGLTRDSSILFVGSDNANYNSSFIKSGRGHWLTFSFDFPKAYVVIKDNFSFNNGVSSEIYRYGDVLYTNLNINGDILNNLVSVGNKYFIGYKYPSGSFNFSLSSNDGADDWFDPSFIDGMNWEVSGTCSVDVENGLFDDEGDALYKYRSISLSNPFPKVDASLEIGYPTNWEDWMTKEETKETNINRLLNTYDVSDYRKYSITISKLDGVDDAVSISSINEYGNDKFYGDVTNIDRFGLSDFVAPTSDYFDDVASNKTYCGLGFFSTSCDLLW